MLFFSNVDIILNKLQVFEPKMFPFLYEKHMLGHCNRPDEREKKRRTNFNDYVSDRNALEHKNIVYAVLDYKVLNLPYQNLEDFLVVWWIGRKSQAKAKEMGLNKKVFLNKLTRSFGAEKSGIGNDKAMV